MKKLFTIFFIPFLILSCSSTNKPAANRDENTIPLEEKMIKIPGGEFIFGDNRKTAYWEKENWRPISIPIASLPQKKLYLNTFYIAKHETTNAQLNRFIQAGGYTKKKYWDDDGWEFVERKNLKVPKYWGKRISHVNSTMEYPNHPALGTSWYEASAYARWRKMRLPTEEEWEKAARGTDGRDFPWGNTFDTYRCNSKESKLQATTLVGGYHNGASPYGVMDLCGNIYEYTSSYLPNEKKIRDTYTLPQEGAKGWAILRGGSWDDFGKVNTVWRRFVASVEERERGRHNGIRLAMDGP